MCNETDRYGMKLDIDRIQPGDACTVIMYPHSNSPDQNVTVFEDAIIRRVYPDIVEWVSGDKDCVGWRSRLEFRRHKWGASREGVEPVASSESGEVIPDVALQMAALSLDKLSDSSKQDLKIALQAAHRNITDALALLG